MLKAKGYKLKPNFTKIKTKSMENEKQNLEENLRAPLDGFLPMRAEAPVEPIKEANPAEPASSAGEEARINELMAHDIKADVVNLGQIENLETINPAPVVADQIQSAPKITENNDSITLSKSKVLMMKKIAQSLKDSAGQLVELLSMVAEDEARIKVGQTGEVNVDVREDTSEPKTAFAKGYGESKENEGSVIEGFFDGEKMVGPDGKTYVVPVNYASKSRLVEGDTLKLIITDTGTFIYKQINPIERRRLVGTLDEGENGEYYVIADDRRWRVLPASITYYKGETGDEVVILIPKSGISRWAAVENVVKR